MVFRSVLAPLVGGVLITASCSRAGSDPGAGSRDDNPFFTESTLLLEIPDFDRIEDRHFTPAFERGMN